MAQKKNRSRKPKQSPSVMDKINQCIDVCEALSKDYLSHLSNMTVAPMVKEKAVDSAIQITFAVQVLNELRIAIEMADKEGGSE
ncbi:hypothetical protein ACFL2D_00005 [Patescibacteria group bacterium]